MSIQFYKSLYTEASFDFITTLVEVNKYAEKHADLLLSAIAMPVEETDEWSINALSILAHELTHYVDMTATIWGMEFIFRKNLLFNKLYTGKGHKDELDVYLLSLSETAMHNELVSQPIEANLLDYETVHSLKYYKVYGAVIIIYFRFNEEVVYSSSVSMLSVIEANATATEIIFKLNRVVEYPDKCVHLKLIEKSYIKLINDSNYSEYNLLLILIEKHFHEFQLLERLTFLQTLIRNVLNMNTFTLAQIANAIQRSFENEFLGNAVSMDIRRGANRHVVVFKLLLFSYEWLNSLTDISKEETKQLFKCKPDQFLKELLKRLNIDISDEMDEIEFTNLLSLYNKIPNHLEKEMINQSSLVNFRETQRKKSFKEMNIFDLKLVNITLGDGYILNMPNSVNLDVPTFFDENINNFSLLTSSYKNLDISKFHLDLDIANQLAQQRPT